MFFDEAVRDAMRAYLTAANRARYAESRADAFQNAPELSALARAERLAEIACQEALAANGWHAPNVPSQRMSVVG